MAVKISIYIGGLEAKNSYCAILYFPDFAPTSPLFAFPYKHAKYAQQIQYRPWKELILTGLPILSCSNNFKS